MSWTNLVPLGLLSWVSSPWDAHIQNTCESSSSDLKKVFCDSSGNFICKIDENLKFCPFFALFWVQKGPEIMARVAYSLHTSQSCSNVLKNNFHVNPVATFYKLDKKLDFWPIFAWFRANKANLRDLIAVTRLVLLLKFDPNHRFFNSCDLEVWWMTSKNYRAHLLYYIKLCGSFQIHWWIQTEVTVRKR